MSKNRLRPTDERGFVAVTTALVLVVLLMFAALGLDVAIFYTRSAQLQRAADAAALAGVTKMPRFAEAQAAATKIANQNRIETSHVIVVTVPNSPRQIKVSVNDPTVRSFFGSFVKKSIGLTRSSIAEYVPKIEMGSRLNAIGTGSIPGWTASGGTQNFWLAINGSCTAREDGDEFASKWDGTRSAAGVATCGGAGAIVNQGFRSEGSSSGLVQPSYSYVVDVPCPTVGQDPCTTPLSAPVSIDVYNPRFDNSNDVSTIDTNVIDPAVNLSQFYAANVTTFFQLRTIDGDDVGQPKRDFFSCFQCAAANGWQRLFDVTTAGKYRVDVSAYDDANAFGSNAFSLVAYSNPGSLPDTDPTNRVLCATTGCPSISGLSSISVYADASGDTADFYLAKLSPARYYRGKRVQVLLFDPGEGARSIQLLGPNNAPVGYQPVGYTFRTWNPALDGYTTDNGFGATPVLAPTYELDVSGLGSSLPPLKQAPWWAAHPPANDSVFNGRVVSLEVQIPPTYGCVAATIPCVEAPLPDDGWWKIRYNTTAAAVSDRTTWTVQLVGDPVHLIHNG